MYNYGQISKTILCDNSWIPRALVGFHIQFAG